MNLTEIKKRVHEIQGWFHNYQMDIIYPFIEKLPDNGLLVEIGTFRGKSTLFYRLTNPNIRIITVDLFKPYLEVNGDTYFSPNIDERVLAEGHIFSINGRSEDVAKGFNMAIDALFIDAEHSYEAVKKDIECWTPFVVQGGTIIFHDYTHQFSGVIKAVDEWLKDNNEFKKVYAGNKIFIAERSSPVIEQPKGEGEFNQL